MADPFPMDAQCFPCSSREEGCLPGRSSPIMSGLVLWTSGAARIYCSTGLTSRVNILKSLESWPILSGLSVETSDSQGLDGRGKINSSVYEELIAIWD